MTYTSGSPARTTAEAKLADKRWRYLNSWWIFPPILSFGLLGWLGFLVAAIRTGRRSYWVFTAVYATLFATFMALAVASDGEGDSSTLTNLAIAPFLGCWLAPTIHAAIVNRKYLRTLAAQGVWYGNPATASSPSGHPQQAAPILGVSRNDYYAPTGPATYPTPQQPWTQAPPQHAPQPYYPAPATTGQGTQGGRTPHAPVPDSPSVGDAPAAPAGGPIDANTATETALAGLPGVDTGLARRIIAVRDARGGYRSLDDLASAANVQPHELVRLRDHLTFDNDARAQDQYPSPGNTGRILDI